MTTEQYLAPNIRAMWAEIDRRRPYMDALTGRRVRVLPSQWSPGGQEGVIRYMYYNGYALVEFEGVNVKGGMLNNDSTYKWSSLYVLPEA